MEWWRKRILDRIAELGLDGTEVAKRAGLNGSFITALKDGTNSSFANILKLLPALGWSLRNLVDESLTSSINLKPLYQITSGAKMPSVNKEPRAVPLSFLDEDIVSLEIKTNEYRAAGYRAGDVVTGPRHRSNNIFKLLGRECIVETANGDTHFRVLSESTVTGCFTLRSIVDPFDEKNAIKDQRVKWAAPIRLILRDEVRDD